MKRKLTALLLTLAALLALAVPAAAEGETDVAGGETYPASETALHTAANGQPYYLMVNRAMGTVTVYTVGPDGNYSLPVRAMPCSVGAGIEGDTPLGTFTLPGARYRWLLMFHDVYTQYAVRIDGHVLFHSIPYATRGKPGTMQTRQYNKLGKPASMGCIRLQFMDTKWIYDNCQAGTLVTIYDDTSSPGPLGKPETAGGTLPVGGAKSGWDPTDTSDDNPWKGSVITGVYIPEDTLRLHPGEQRALTSSYEPSTAKGPTIQWVSSDPDVATVDMHGLVTAKSEGTVVIACHSATAFDHVVLTVERDPIAYPSTQTVTVDGEAIEFQMYALRENEGVTNYIRLRDLGAAFSGTPAQFEVGYHGMVNIATGWNYTPDGTEGKVPFTGERVCRRLTEQTNVDGTLLDLEGIVLTDDAGGGYTYYKLRDLGEALGFKVDWAPGTGIIVTTKEEEPTPTESAAPTDSPEPTGSAAPTDSPEPTESGEPTASPEPAESEEPAGSAAPSVSPAPEEGDAPAETHEPEETPQPSPEPTAEPAPETKTE